jgi:DNA polymerase III subunit epsilon
MREIILDTETTGLDPQSGHRLVEVAGVELENLVATGRTFHSYIDPQRAVPDDAVRIHGLTTEFLAGKPLFRDICSDLLAFLGDARLVIHNAEFDMKFLNAELRAVGRDPLGMDRVLDTLALARRKHPGASNSLDALCARYRIDNSRRTKHGALLDSEILAEVYIELMGGRQTNLALGEIRKKAMTRVEPAPVPVSFQTRSLLTQGDIDKHAAIRTALGEKAVWNKYLAR